MILLPMTMIQNCICLVLATTKETIIVKNVSNVFAVFTGITINVFQVRHSRVQRVEAKKKRKGKK